MARMQWADKGEGNHNPVVVINGHYGPSPLVIQAKAGETIRLNASQSFDSDKDILGFLWWQQPEIGTAKLTINDAESSKAAVYIPADAAGQRLHLVCEVSDQGPFHLKGYQRIIMDIDK